MASPFSYQPYDGSAYVPTIAELLAHSGDPAARAAQNTAAAQARARMVSGDVWGRAIQQSGQIPGQVLAQQRDEQDRAQERQVRDLAIKGKTQEIAGNDANQAEAKKQRIVTTVGALAKGAGSSEEFVSRVHDLAALGGMPQDVADHIAETVTKGGDWAAAQKQYVDFAGQYAKPMEVPAGGKVINPVTNEVIAENPKPAAAPTTAGLATLAAKGDPSAIAALKLLHPEKPANRTGEEQELDAYAKSLGKTKAEDLTYADRMQFQKDKGKVIADQSFLQHQREREYDITHPVPEKAKSQDALEQEYRTVLARGLSSRSGGLGLEDAKVQQANHLLALLHQTYDPKTDAYNIPKTLQSELAAGLARLVAPSGNVGIEMMREFNQRTAKGDIAGALSYVTGHPFPTATQDFAKLLKDSIERQGQVAQENREGEMSYLRNLAPTELNEARRQQLESVSLNPLRQSRVIQNTATGERKMQVSLDGGKTWK